MKAVFRVEVEVSQMEGCQLPDDCKGAFVNVYIGSDSIKNAIDIVEASLLNDCYKPVRTYAAYELDLEEDNEVDKKGYPNPSSSVQD